MKFAHLVIFASFLKLFRINNDIFLIFVSKIDLFYFFELDFDFFLPEKSNKAFKTKK